METITPDEFSNIPSVNGRKRFLIIEQNTPNKKKKVTTNLFLHRYRKLFVFMMHKSSIQNIGAKNLIIKRRRANNHKPEVTLDLTKYTKEICDVTNEHEPEIWMEGIYTNCISLMVCNYLVLLRGSMTILYVQRKIF